MARRAQVPTDTPRELSFLDELAIKRAMRDGARVGDRILGISGDYRLTQADLDAIAAEIAERQRERDAADAERGLVVTPGCARSRCDVCADVGELDHDVIQLGQNNLSRLYGPICFSTCRSCTEQSKLPNLTEQLVAARSAAHEKHLVELER